MTAQSDKRRGPLLWLADRSRRSWIGAVVLIGLAASYLLAIGPAMWLCLHRSPISWEAQTITRIYSPLGWRKSCGGWHVSVAEKSPEPVRSAFVGYLGLWGWTQPFL
jgi:hypothetical protein